MPPAPADPSLPARLREFHQRLPLAGDPPNAVLSLPDDRLLSLAALLRDAPIPPPALEPDEWQEFLDLLRPHGVYPLLSFRLRAWPEDCRPPGEVTDYLDRLFFDTAAPAIVGDPGLPWTSRPGCQWRLRIRTEAAAVCSVDEQEC